jgi:asparagine synthase (glutamine-hydrolysing)
LRIGPVGNSVARPFWQPRIRVEGAISERDWIEEMRRRVLQTVETHMLSDVPVGAFLSGGADSGAVVAAMAQGSGPDFTAFTAGFPGSNIDETEAARAVAAHVGCRHVVLPIEPETAADVLPAVQRSFDEPTAANSAIPLWYLARSASRHVKVVLCGEGGDELFLGYNRQRWAERMRRWGPLVRAVGGRDFLSNGHGLGSRKLNYLRDYAARFRDGALLANGYERFFAAVTITPAAVRSRLFSSDFRAAPAERDELETLAAEYFPERQEGLPDLAQFMLGDLSVHMPASLLQRLDRATMAHSLEARVPFLSRSFVDWALTIPTELKIRGNTGKYVLRKAVEPWLPEGALKRSKLGFQMPLADWFVGGFSDFAREAWLSSGAADAGYLDGRAVEQLFADHRAGRANHGRILYAIAMFSCWWNEQRYMPTHHQASLPVTAAV